MLNWLTKQISSLARTNTSQPPSEPLEIKWVVYPRDEHNISRKEISDAALKVMYRLNSAGYEAYLVGGGVRDLLLGGHPKDFDVATNATPEQVREQFRNSRIIGRRFKIVHVSFGREIIEVTTFRGHHEQRDPDEEADERPASKQHAARDDAGMLLRDNVYGSIEEDAIRRDFTVNALYYSVRDFTVHDFCNGVEDLKHRVLRIIGHPETRYREDPVRMLRAVRLAAKLGFSIDPATAAPILNLRQLLQNVPPARLFDEILKLFMAGFGVATFELLREFNLFEQLFPDASAQLSDDANLNLVLNALAGTDQRINDGKTVTPAFLFAALLWPAIRHYKASLEASGMDAMPALHEAANVIINSQCTLITIPRRFQIPMREIWELQLRLPHCSGKRAQRTLEHPRFRAAYDFLLLREQSGEIEPGLGDWWTQFQSAETDQRDDMVREAPQTPRTRPPRRRRRYHGNGGNGGNRH
jgi:poly(A) polymerase